MNVQCDRCKKIYNKDNPEPYIGTQEELPCYLHTEISYYGTWLLGQDPSDKYLCPECTHKLWKWINEG